MVLKGVDVESLCDSSKRHFLGLREHAEIHLGTKDSNHKVTTRPADEERSRLVIALELPLTIGSRGMGVFGQTGQLENEIKTQGRRWYNANDFFTCMEIAILINWAHWMRN